MGQTNKFFYFDNHDRLVTDTTKAIIRKERKELSEKKQEIVYAVRSSSGWVENGKREVTNQKKENKFEIIRDIYGTGFNTTIEIIDTLPRGFRFREYHDKFCFREGEALVLFPLILKGNCSYFSRSGNGKTENCLYWNNIKYEEVYLLSSPEINDSSKLPDLFPQYPGGIKVLFDDMANLILYPSNVNIQELSDTALVSIKVNENGRIASVNAVKSINPLIDSCLIEAVLKLKSPWIAAIKNKQFVPFEYILPFSFSKEEKTESQQPKIFFSVEQMPSYPGGEEALRNEIGNNIRYPIEAQKKGIEGKVFVNFVVDKAGKIQNIKVVRHIHPDLDAEAARVVSTLKQWIPGMQKGEKVCVSYTIPINFVLRGSNTAIQQQQQSTW